MVKKIKSIDITEITFGQYPAELTINFNEPIQSVNLNKITLTDIPFPSAITGFKLKSVNAS